MKHPYFEGTDSFEKVWRERRRMIVQITPDMLATLLQLPESTVPLDVFIDEFTQTVCLTISDPDFPECPEAARIPIVIPEYDRLTGCGHARFLHYKK